MKADISGSTIKITQGKTGINLAIEMGEEFQNIVSEYQTNPIASPYLIRRLPDRKVLKAKNREHISQVLPDYLSKHFAKYRDLAGVYEGMSSKEKPSFHEIRALGSQLYEKAGYDQDYIQALMGHSSVKMTEHYQDGHEVKYVKVKAELSLKG